MPKRKIERFPLALHHANGPNVLSLPSGSRKMVDFGTNHNAALQKYLMEREEWQAGRNPCQTLIAVILSD